MTAGGYLEDILHRTEEDLAKLQNSKTVNSNAKLLSMLGRLEKLHFSLREVADAFDGDSKAAISAILEKEESLKNSQNVISELKRRLSKSETEQRTSNDYVCNLKSTIISLNKKVKDLEWKLEIEKEFSSKKKSRRNKGKPKIMPSKLPKAPNKSKNPAMKNALNKAGLGNKT